MADVWQGGTLHAVGDVTVYAVRDLGKSTEALVPAIWYLLDDLNQPLDEPAAPTVSYTVSMSPGLYKLGVKCDDDPPFDKGVYPVVLYGMKPMAATFGGGNHIINPDNPNAPEPYNEPYTADQWYDHDGDGVTDMDFIANPADHDGHTIDRRLPVAYTRNTPITITDFKALVDAGQDSLENDLPPPDMFFYRAIHDNAAGDPTVLYGAYPAADAIADTPLPDSIYYDPGYQLRWEVSFDGQHLWFPIGTTTHEVYVTLADPASPSIKTHTFFYIAASSADGATSPEQMIDMLWQAFSDREVADRNGWVMGYYAGIYCPSDCTTYDPYNLVITGNGQCGAWALLFAACLDVHGTVGINWIQAEPDAAVLPERCFPLPDPFTGSTHGFLINNYWQSDSGLTQCDNFPLRLNPPCTAPWILTWASVDISDSLGIPGQDNQDPASFFERHFVIQVADRFYDPSYGGSSWNPFTLDAAAAQWENSAVSAYYDIVDVTTGPSGPQVRYGARNNSVEYRETRFSATPY